MARRPRAPRGPRAVRSPRGVSLTTTGAVGGGDLYEAAEAIAPTAQRFASTWSRSIRVGIEISGDTADIYADAPPAYPAETRARHPLFGNRESWWGPPGERFMGPAADSRAGKALARYAKKVDAMCREAGFS